MSDENVEQVEPVAETPVAETPAEPGPSLADAVTAGIESAPERGPKQPVEEGTAEPEGEEGAAAGEGEEKPDAEKSAEAGSKDPKDEAGDKKADHVNDPVPKEWSERARERITSLVSSVKEKDATIANQGNLIDAVVSTGASPDQFAGIITYLRNLNSSDPANLEQCLKDMDTMRQNIAMRLGKPVAGVDFLAQHPDLQEEVKYGQITQARAQEIAIGRARLAAEGEQRTRTQATERETAAQAAERDAATKDLNDLGDVLAASDPNYNAKYDAILPQIETFGALPPAQWRGAFLKAYREVKLPTAAAPAPGAAPAMVRDPVTGQFVTPGKKTPIRPQSPSGTGGSKPAPKSLREAIDFSLAGDGN